MAPLVREQIRIEGEPLVKFFMARISSVLLAKIEISAC